MILPDEYKTGNTKMDALIEKALAQESQVAADVLLLHHKAGEIKRHKYGVSNKSKRTNGEQVWASTKEMERYNELLLEQKAKRIKDLRQQVPFVLQEEFISKQYGVIKAITYIADFVYTNISLRKGLENRDVVEDAKGFKTQEYKLKRKLFLYRFGSYLFFEV